MSNSEKNNYAFIDGQNLHMGTWLSEPVWKIDLARFRIFLEKRYKVSKAYYFLGYIKEGDKIESIYEEIQQAGFILVFRQHTSAMVGNKKGNVDSDIIFSIMKRLYKDEDFEKIVLVSGDGDYKMLVDFLIEEKRFEKVLFPNRKYRSSLYKELSNKYFAYLDDKDTKEKIAKKEYRQKEKGALGS